jgi:glycosyltransferase involved in cell wall biosynthesis/cephalosporin hydroxylase
MTNKSLDKIKSKFQCDGGSSFTVNAYSNGKIPTSVTYDGLTIMQHQNIVYPFTELLKNFKPVRIIEIGTAYGGLTLFLKDLLEVLGIKCKIITYDIYNSVALKDRVASSVQVITKNLFSADYNSLVEVDEIRTLIQSEGPTLLLCDGGNKINEFNLLSNLLKEGDIIMAHDYAASSEVFNAEILGKIWYWMEIQYSDIKDSIFRNNLSPHMYDAFQKVAWVCMKKDKQDLSSAKLSLTLIVKNEEAHLDYVLRHANVFADEIVIIDTGSTDKTKEIAREYTSNVYDFEWVDDFSLARNFGIEKCTGDYIMWLDADDEISEDDAKKLKELKKTMFEYEMYFLPYFCSKDLQGNPTMRTVRERIFKNDPKFRFSYPIHEAVFYSHDTKRITLDDISVIHSKKSYAEGYNDRNLQICNTALKSEKYAENPRLWWVYGRELSSMHFKYTEAIEAYRKAIEYSDSSEIFSGYLYHDIGTAYLRSGLSRTEALFHFKIAKTLVKDWRDPLYKIYEIYFEDGDLIKAKAALEEILLLPTHCSNEVSDPKIYDNEYIQGLIDNRWSY